MASGRWLRRRERRNRSPSEEEAGGIPSIPGSLHQARAGNARAIAELLREPDSHLPREAVAKAVLRYPDTRAALALFPPDGKPREHLFMFRAVIQKQIRHGRA